MEIRIMARGGTAVTNLSRARRLQHGCSGPPSPWMGDAAHSPTHTGFAEPQAAHAPGANQRRMPANAADPRVTWWGNSQLPASF